MPTFKLPYIGQVPQIARPRISIGFRLLRDGEVTTTPKSLRLYSDWSDLSPVLVFRTKEGQGEFTQLCNVDLAAIISRADWLAAGVDDTPPHRTKATYITINQSGVMVFNITAGDGGTVTDPATVDAVVRLDGVEVEREVVILERPPTGEWRVAGYGSPSVAQRSLSLGVVGGDCFAVCVDSFGIAYTSTLDVTAGQTIRPSQYTGWLYRITEPGTLPATEPQWWAAEGDNAPRLLGTARAIAVRYYQPLAHGPVPVEII